MQGRWEFNINVWFRYFQNRIIMFCLPISTFMYRRAIYIFPGSVCLFCCSQIGRLILGIYKSSTDTWMYKFHFISENTLIGFSVQCRLSSCHLTQPSNWRPMSILDLGTGFRRRHGPRNWLQIIKYTISAKADISPFVWNKRVVQKFQQKKMSDVCK